MANRADEKARRRAERQAAEEAERKAAGRKRRMQIIGGVLGTLAVAGAAVALILSGSDGGGSGGDDPKAATPDASVPIPAPKIGDFEEAAKAAGCDLKHPPLEGAGHEEKTFTPADYQTNPPTSGPHTPDWAQDGIYDPGNTPELGQLVHTLEHGRIDVQYAPGTPANKVAQLETLVAELEDGYHMLLFENTTDMEYEVAATAWGHLLGCAEFNDEVFDAIRTFRQRYTDKGPENVP